GRDFRRGHLLALGLDPGIAVVRLDDLVGHHVDVLLHHLVTMLATNESLDGKQGVMRIGHRLTLGRATDQGLAVVGKRHDAGRGALTFGVFDHTNVSTFGNRHTGVGGSQVNADDLAHWLFSLKLLSIQFKRFERCRIIWGWLRAFQASRAVTKACAPPRPWRAAIPGRAADSPSG